jgi:hypothetical protein
MLKNKENLTGEPKGDRFIPSEIRSCAFQVEYNRPNRQTASSNYEELLGKGILDEIDLLSNHKIMNFSNKPTQNNRKNLNKPDLSKPFKKSEGASEKKTRKISKKPYKIL